MRTEYNNYASQALEKAAQDAASCHQKYIGTEHLILGLLAQPDSLSGRVLYENGLNYENFLEAVLGESAVSWIQSESRTCSFDKRRRSNSHACTADRDRTYFTCDHQRKRLYCASFDERHEY